MNWPHCSKTNDTNKSLLFTLSILSSCSFLRSRSFLVVVGRCRLFLVVVDRVSIVCPAQCLLFSRLSRRSSRACEPPATTTNIVVVVVVKSPNNNHHCIMVSGVVIGACTQVAWLHSFTIHSPLASHNNNNNNKIERSSERAQYLQIRHPRQHASIHLFIYPNTIQRC